MILLKENTVKQNGILIGEPLILKTRAIDINLNEKTLIVEVIPSLLAEFLLFKKGKLKQVRVIPIDKLSGVPIDWNAEILTSWQKQNELIKNELVKKGIAKEKIIICEDINENGEPINILNIDIEQENTN